MRLGSFRLLLAMGLALWFVSPAHAMDDEHWAKAQEAIKKGIAFLRTTQEKDGSWSPKPGPAITALAVRVMSERPEVSATDPGVKLAITYILGKVKPDGGIHDGFLQNYNTAICLSGLSAVNARPDVADAVKKAQDFLRAMQWSDQPDPSGKKVDESHPFYGGAGYGGKSGRPDLSNLHIMLDGLHDSGLDCNDPAYQRALVFISRCQASDANKSPWRGQLSNDGGMIYTTSKDRDHVGVPDSEAGTETVDVPGKGEVSVLRSYGSMTYAGFKSYLYANLDRNDQRVKDAFKWIQNNYSVAKNPGFAEGHDQEGLYYYLMTFSRAMSAWGSTTIKTADGKTHDWANDLVDQLVATQKPDGSWSNSASRWMETDANLVTCYALIALETAAH